MKYDSKEVLQLNSPEGMGALRLSVIGSASHNLEAAFNQMTPPKPEREIRVPVSEEVHKYQAELERKVEVATEVKDMTIERLSEQAAALADPNPLFPHNVKEVPQPLSNQLSQMEGTATDDFNIALAEEFFSQERQDV